MTQYTKKAILNTFQEMLEKVPFDKITVSALVANCEISSNTFYYHYHDIYDMLDAWLATKMDRYRLLASDGGRWQDLLKTMLHDMQKNSELVYHLFNSLSRERIERYVFDSLDDTFYRLVLRAVEDIDIPEEVMRDFAEYNSYSFLGFFLKFLWNHMNDDIDKGVERIGVIFDANIAWLKSHYGRKRI